MIAIREIQEVKSGSVTVKLPPSFNGQRVEIIILPVDDLFNGSQDLQELLLAAPTITDEELQEFQTVRAWMNEWRVQDF
jgi:hypothetical protein